MSRSQSNAEQSTLQILARRAHNHQAVDPFIDNDKYAYLVVHEEHGIPADFDTSTGLTPELVDKLHQPDVQPKQALKGSYTTLSAANVAAVNVIKQIFTNWKDIVFIEISPDDNDSPGYEAVKLYHADGGVCYHIHGGEKVHAVYVKPLRVKEHNTEAELKSNETPLRHMTAKEYREHCRHRTAVEKQA
ncbi:hypothetical protein HII31_01737 [Pseudocercospora fuligena]|uniref:Uncharacterized protein n=1 Tax=Pseudocercospora fuligena TaxID=685502 RepID=A0A8H6RTA8_9PEZI|nr:hypothetical protein HII31_01737 [Pseudocercospora fuligena]